MNSMPGATPGAILKAAREKHGFSVVDVASKMCLGVQYIEDIEQDDYSHMSAKVYARGRVLSYAQLLGVPEADILAALNQVQMTFIPPKTVSVDNLRASPISYQPESSQQRSSLFLWGSVLVIIVVVGLGMLWWQRRIKQ